MLFLLHALQIALITLLDNLGLSFTSRSLPFLLPSSLKLPQFAIELAHELFVSPKALQQVLVLFKLLTGHDLDLLHRFDKLGVDLQILRLALWSSPGISRLVTNLAHR